MPLPVRDANGHWKMQTGHVGLTTSREVKAAALFNALDADRDGYIDDEEIGLLAALCLCAGADWDCKTAFNALVASHEAPMNLPAFRQWVNEEFQALGDAEYEVKMQGLILDALEQTEELKEMVTKTCP